MMKYFVEKQSVVREIWGKSNTILFIFAGASAEFTLNKAVDWLYFTGRLPQDPIGRLFSTVSYARQIVFSDNITAMQAIDAISQIHAKVEVRRGSKIPDWAYRDVLFMLIHYSIAAFETLERKLTWEEKEEVFQVFHKVGSGMNLHRLPKTFEAWQYMRQLDLEDHLSRSHYTDDLFKQYKKHLGNMRYKLLLEVQKLLVPKHVFELLEFKRRSLLKPLVKWYKLLQKFKVDLLLKALLLPPKYKAQIKALDNFQSRASLKQLDVAKV